MSADDRLQFDANGLPVPDRMELARLAASDRRTRMWTDTVKHVASTMVIVALIFVCCPLVCS